MKPQSKGNHTAVLKKDAVWAFSRCQRTPHTSYRKLHHDQILIDLCRSILLKMLIKSYNCANFLRCTVFAKNLREDLIIRRWKARKIPHFSNRLTSGCVSTRKSWELPHRAAVLSRILHAVLLDHLNQILEEHKNRKVGTSTGREREGDSPRVGRYR